MSRDYYRCVECSDLFDPNYSLYWTHDRETDDWLCAECTKTYNRIASEKIIKAIQDLPNLERLALSDMSLSGADAILQEIEDSDNDY
jgi:hypothetical protein